jgi:hypothetical protein
MPSKKTINSSLCSSCEYDEGCSLKSSKDKPVQFCEEYYISKTKIAEKKNSYKTDKQIEEDNSFRGLCANCAKKKDCVYLNKELGVWHCEEYC